MNAGLSMKQAGAVAAVIVAGQRDECHSHGLYRLIGCAHVLATGRVNKSARPKVTDAAPSLVKVNADYGFSSYTYNEGIGLALDEARSQAWPQWRSTNAIIFLRCGLRLRPWPSRALRLLHCKTVCPPLPVRRLALHCASEGYSGGPSRSSPQEDEPWRIIEK
ncbi:Ldh family oxidoreductase, partial [Mesorhizobium captivum]|uniref:Ldh family oxidoreductase n=1 Tax=Mesorhizobium captivum TaxID=3072319 RepID=UPI003D30FD1C